MDSACVLLQAGISPVITSGRPSSTLRSVEGTIAQCCALGMTSLQELHAASAVNSNFALSVCL